MRFHLLIDFIFFNFSTFQLFNFSTFQLFNFSTFQLFNFSTFQPFNFSTFQLFNLSTSNLNQLSLLNSSDYFQFDGDWSGEAVDFYCGSARRVFGKRFGPDFIEYWKIVFHVGEENGDVDNFIPGTSCVFEDEFHILKNASALCFDIVGNDFSIGIEFNSGNYFCSFFAWADARKKK